MSTPPYLKNIWGLLHQKFDDKSLGLMHQSKVTLTNNQIKALPTTFQTIIPAPGTNRIALFCRGLLILNTTAGAYTNVAGANFTGDLQHRTSQISASNYLDNLRTKLGAAAVSYISLTAFIDGFTATTTGLLENSDNASSDINDSVELALFNGSPGLGDFTGGNAANTMTIHASYLILNTSTGDFE